MKVKNISLKNFRNHQDLNLDFNSDVIVFHGPNATGKTNLLESIYFLSLFKSFRDASNYLFLKGAFNLEIKATIEKEGREHTIEIFLENRGKIFANFRLDGVRKTKKQLESYIAAVIFDPTHVDLLNKSPEERRRYLNVLLSQKSSDYLENLYNYKKIVTQKNQLLANIRNGKSSPNELHSWNEQMALFGTEIIEARREYTNYLNQAISEVYAAVSGFARPIEVEYQSIPGQGKIETLANFKKLLFDNQQREIYSASSLIGPHRDDFTLKSEGLYLAPFSSRGELRSQVLSLKILELEYLKNGDDHPILLLDDVLSELDEDRRVFLLKYLKGRFQTFITSTVPIEMEAQHVNLKQLVNQ
ncbi:MAG: replication and repair protein RecF [Candidatus Doudnabacteria bacterium]|nr:replication and repair protein RecF [Candidatus Doudnabacteria bacterium]